MNKDIFLTNSYGGKKEKFQPIDKSNIKMYVCGPTVYDDPHIGNARPLVVFDLLFKVLKCKYGNDKVTYVRNITDIDDKIIQSAKDKKISIKDLTTKINNNFQDDCNYLNCEKPSFQPKATENIQEMIEMISILIEKGFAYESKNHIYFEVNKFKDYGKLSNKKIDDLISGSRVEVSSNKKNAEDFVLWKPSNEDEPSWASPWGKGRPGWHLECSAMSKKYLGDKFDIHGGGRDLLFPHHENEIAQSCCANDSEVMANFWLHNGYVTSEGEKMSKSLGNFTTINELLFQFNGEAIRYALLQAHYRAPLSFSKKSLEEAKKSLSRLYRAVDGFEVNGNPDKELIINLCDDINTPKALARAHYLTDQANKGSKECAQKLKNSSKILGVLSQSTERWFKFEKKDNQNQSLDIALTEKEIDELILKRQIAKENKDYTNADQIREQLLKLDIILEDKPDKTIWRKS